MNSSICSILVASKRDRRLAAPKRNSAATKMLTQTRARPSTAMRFATLPDGFWMLSDTMLVSRRYCIKVPGLGRRIGNIGERFVQRFPTGEQLLQRLLPSTPHGLDDDPIT